MAAMLAKSRCALWERFLTVVQLGVSDVAISCDNRANKILAYLGQSGFCSASDKDVSRLTRTSDFCGLEVPIMDTFRDRSVLTLRKGAKECSGLVHQVRRWWRWGGSNP